jgi:uncharacterized protein YjiS (DUF1127 family)
MNGLSDVRLTLHSPQLLAEHRVYHSAPADLGRWGLFLHRSRTRRALLNLDEQQLRDVGLSRELAQREGLKPFWRS